MKLILITYHLCVTSFFHLGIVAPPPSSFSCSHRRCFRSGGWFPSQSRCLSVCCLLSRLLEHIQHSVLAYVAATATKPTISYQTRISQLMKSYLILAVFPPLYLSVRIFALIFCFVQSKRIQTIREQRLDESRCNDIQIEITSAWTRPSIWKAA